MFFFYLYNTNKTFFLNIFYAFIQQGHIKLIQISET